MTDAPNAHAQIAQTPSEPSRLVIVGLFPMFDTSTLFDCWIRPDALTQWWPQQATVDPKLNGPYSFAWPSQKQTLFGTFTEFDRPHKLAFSWRWAGSDADPTYQVALTFESYLVGADVHGAKLTLVHGPYTNSEADQKMRNEHHLPGWLHFLPLLENVGLA